MTLRARDLMQTHVLTVSPETPLLDIHRLFVEEEINGAPVVDDDGAVVGVISSRDLLRAVEEEHDAGAATSIYFREYLEFSGPDWSAAPEDLQDRLGQRCVADAMTDEVISVSTEASIADVARTLRTHRVHRVLVVDGGRLAGILSTFDLVTLLEKETDTPGT
jgi:CBS domain-containing protein